MNIINLHTDTLRSEQYLGSEPTDRATWLNLLAWCVSQENGGHIEGASEWGERKWMQLCGVTKAEAHSITPLFHLDEAGTLHIEFYPLESEEKVRAKREAGRIGGKAKTQAKTQAAKTNGTRGGRPLKPKHTPETQAETQGKGKGKGKEKEKVKERERGTRPRLSPSPEAFEATEEATDTVTQQAHTAASIAAKILTLRPEWARPGQLTHIELHAIADSREAFATLEPNDWDLLRDYLRAAPPAGSNFWQPSTRSRFIENFADVLTHAHRWDQKKRPGSRGSGTSTPKQDAYPPQFAAWHAASPYRSVATSGAWTTPSIRAEWQESQTTAPA